MPGQKYIFLRSDCKKKYLSSRSDTVVSCVKPAESFWFEMVILNFYFSPELYCKKSTGIKFVHPGKKKTNLPSS